MKTQAVSILKFKKIQSYSNGADYMLISSSGWYRSFCAVDQALIVRVTMSCSDNKHLAIKWQMRDLMGYDFEPYIRTIDFSTELLYPDAAFGYFGKDGVIYEKLDYETVLLHIYEDGKDEVAEFQKDVSKGEELYQHLEKPDEWKEVTNVYDAYVDPIR